MNRLSIKSRVTLWYMASMLLIVALVLTFVFFISDTLLRSSVQSRLKGIVSISINEIKELIPKHGDMQIADELDEIDYFQSGIYLSVYHEDGELIYGRMPSGFNKELPFSTDKMQTSENGEHHWYVYDLKASVRKYGEIWVRGVASLSDTESATHTMINLALIALPFIVIIAGTGGYFITKRAFRPIMQIISAAEKIGSGDDLSQRINLGDRKDEIYTLANAFDNMFDRLQRSFETEKQFTSDASHELRTPTSVILSQCEYALENATTLEEAQRSLTVVLGQTKKMSGLICQLLMLARTDKRSRQTAFELMNISELAEIVVEEQGLFAAEKNIEIKTQIEPYILLRADQTMMMRLFINLISNGITYGRENGFIVVKLVREPPFVVGTVEDNGIGIAKEHLGKIWDRFYQVDPSRTADKDGGMGLGLSMARWIVQIHGGTITATSTLGQGSSFVFKIPVTY